MKQKEIENKGELCILSVVGNDDREGANCLVEQYSGQKTQGGSGRENVEHGVPFVAIVERIPVADA